MPDDRTDPPYEEPVDDAERYQDGLSVLGGPVDEPPGPRTVYGTVTGLHDQARRPIVAGWLRNPQQRREVARAAVRVAAHRAGYHATRSPKYLGKVLLWSPVGLFTSGWRLIRWAFDLEGWATRQHAASRNAVDDYLALSKQRDRRVAARVRVLLLGLVAVAVGIVLLVALAPGWVLVAAAAAALVALAWLGRPADRPLTDRVTIGQPFVRLTAEQVRGALCTLGISRIREPGDLTFPEPGIHRDGPGWLARVNLPAGVEVSEVLERRGRLSSALRLPVDQVWPAAGPEHAGQLDLWVGYLPASRMGQPKWSLAGSSARTSVFEPAEFGTDQRQRPVLVSLFANNFLVGGRPGSGKSFGARTIATIAALDPTCELKIVEYKGTGDFLDFAPLCSTYACGLSDADFATGLEVLMWGLREAERRGERIRKAYERGEAPERKVTPELAARAGSGLHPVVIVVDEAHELFGDDQVGKQAAEAAIRLAKRGRALGLTLVICTQIPDKDALPPALTRCIGIRWCMAVPDQVANDQILGTGAYKRGLTGTVYRPGADAGWGVIVGLLDATAVRSQFPDPATAKAIMARAAQLRGAVVGDPVDGQERVDVLADVRRVFYAGEVFVSWQQLTARLAEIMPERYTGVTQDAVSALVRGADPDLKSWAGKDRGSRKTLNGLLLDHLTEALSRREIGGPQ